MANTASTPSGDDDVLLIMLAVLEKLPGDAAIVARVLADISHGFCPFALPVLEQAQQQLIALELATWQAGDDARPRLVPTAQGQARLHADRARAHCLLMEIEQAGGQTAHLSAVRDNSWGAPSALLRETLALQAALGTLENRSSADQSAAAAILHRATAELLAISRPCDAGPADGGSFTPRPLRAAGRA